MNYANLKEVKNFIKEELDSASYAAGKTIDIFGQPGYDFVSDIFEGYIHPSDYSEIVTMIDLEIEFGMSKYGIDMLYKTWNFKISDSRKEAFDVITAHAAGTVSDPLSRYDISAYLN